MDNNAKKFVFLAVVFAAVLFSRLAYPYSSDTASTGTSGTTTTSSRGSNDPPLLILPSLTADVSAQDTSVSSSNTGTSTAKSTLEIFGGSSATFSRVGTSEPPTINDAAELIADLDTGTNLLADNVNARWPLASVSKLMTAIVATDLMDPNQQVTITANMTAADPTESILHVGDVYTVSDLLRVMLLPSNNVAAEALAQAYGRPQFLAAMNAKAESWGMGNTYYNDPSGLSAANESTADDLLDLAQHIYNEYPQILVITRTPQFTATNLADNKKVTVKSINDFAGQPDFIGGKTGYTDQADGNLLSIFSYEGRPVLVIILGTNDGDRFNDTQSLFTWFKANYK